MPGYVMHIAVAKKVLEKLGQKDESYISDYMLGSIVADAVTREQKKVTHFWSDEEYKKLVRTPSLDAFVEEYKEKLTDPFVIGYYNHLYFDKMYLDRYWKDNFTFFDENEEEKEGYEEVKLVKVKGHESLYDRYRFFSNEYFYGDYDKINRYIIYKFNVSYMKKSSIPDWAIEKLKYVDNKQVQEMIDFVNKEVDIVKSSDVDIPRLTVLDIHEIIELMNDMIEDNYIFAHGKSRT